MSRVAVVMMSSVNTQSALMHRGSVEAEDAAAPELLVAVIAMELAGRKGSLVLSSLALKTQTQPPEDA